jgi:1,4-dihydroxy-2-naphthoate octaprenyltransferase
MATVAQWIEGARPRTLPNAVAPVLAGSGAAASIGGFTWWKALLALVVSLAFIIGVNFANDYSDGVRGTDDDRVGPIRLVGSGAAKPAAVKTAAFACFGVACAAGLVLAATTAWWLVAIGVFCVLGAWFYTGGSHPYGYAGYGEIAVFVFFGLVAVLGTQFTQAGRISAAGWVCAVAMGLFSSGVLIANNLRDIPTDSETGKITLAVRLGDKGTRIAYAAVALVAWLSVVLLPIGIWWKLLAIVLVALPLARAYRPIGTGKAGMALIPVLRDTGLAMLVWALAADVAFALPQLL